MEFGCGLGGTWLQGVEVKISGVEEVRKLRPEYGLGHLLSPERVTSPKMEMKIMSWLAKNLKNAGE